MAVCRADGKACLQLGNKSYTQVNNLFSERPVLDRRVEAGLHVVGGSSACEGLEIFMQGIPSSP